MRGSTKRLKELEARITVLDEYMEALQQSINYMYNRLEALETALGVERLAFTKDKGHNYKFIQSDDV